jgi:glycosyltransferase involved in cell wall biosynthesis
MAVCREIATRLHGEDTVTFAGHVDEDTLGRWWASASVYATASLHEAFGIGLAQGLVAGLPVVASAIPAHREVIDRAGSGMLAELCPVDAADTDTASQYADAISRLLSSTESRAQRAERCELPTAAQMADQLLETLTSVTG